ncbi:hypothetical protein [Psychrobacter aestuarii]|nr:hypothetical protein [Psychrobacter aestuarii]
MSGQREALGAAVWQRTQRGVTDKSVADSHPILIDYRQQYVDS